MSEPELAIFPIEIRPGLVVKVQIPRDLTAAEAEKIAKVVRALVHAAPRKSRAVSI